MTPEPLAPKRRLQLHLADLVFVAVLVGIVCSFILPLFYSKRVGIDPGLPYPSVAIISVPPLPVAIVSAGVFGVIFSAIPIILIGHRLAWPRLLNWVMAGVLGIALSLFIPTIPDRMRWIRYTFLSSSISRGYETAGVAACKAYCTAQDIYHRVDYDRNGVLEYSTSGSGLYGADGNIALIDRSFAAAFYGEANPLAKKSGYIFKVLKAQSANARGGKFNYIETDSKGQEHMTKGYALVAAPAVYGCGVVSQCGGNTFIVNQDGTIYQCDFGEKTPEVFKSMIEFDPDPARWEIAE